METTVLLEENRFFPGDQIAIGDIHGRIDLLWKLVNFLKGTQVNLLFLGDLIDRAKKPEDDVAVLNVIKLLMDDPQAYGLMSVEALKGNHEDMFLNAVSGDDFRTWVRNFGAWEVFSELSEHAGWLNGLPLYRLIDRTLYVHAGVRPGTPLDQQTSDDLVWIRGPFLEATELAVEGVDRVVHGHTPNFCGFPVVKNNRICLDSAAYWSGRLTGYNQRTGELFQVTDGN